MAAVAAAQKNREMFAIKKSYSVENGLEARHKTASLLILLTSPTYSAATGSSLYGGNGALSLRKLHLTTPAAVLSSSHSLTFRKAIFQPQISNGYPARRRSLVDDARFETLVVKQTKQTVLDEARLRANDSSVDPDSEDEQCNQPEEPTNKDDTGLTEEEIVLANAITEDPESEKIIQRAALILHLKDGMSSLARVLKSVEKNQGVVVHLETRPSQGESARLDTLLKVDMTRINMLLLLKNLRQSQTLQHATLIGEDNISAKNPWFPRHASELDSCNHLMTKYEPDLDMNHPGFADKVYRARRKEIAEIAFAYKYGDSVPFIEYTETENKTWKSVFTTVVDLAPKHACAEYRRVFKVLQDEGLFVPDKIPQLEDMSKFMQRNTGFTLRPAAGLLTARDFLASLAFRIFQSTQYIRHINSPFHTPEPDAIHEILGHMPLLADPSFAQFSQEIGLASLGASDEEIEKLSTVSSDLKSAS
ncbi:hypothetical protein HUJ05_009133 [Dendroctonus ponderosae]|nr:hypothetical protein HUJ05_009133 [Dendroctonus ponderosae]